MNGDTDSVNYNVAGEKFLELAAWDEKVFRDHIKEYEKQVFQGDKIKTLEDALEYATRAIELYKKGLKAREDRQNVYNELSRVFSNSTNQRFKVMAYLLAVDIPPTKTQIAKAVFGDEKRLSVVSDNIRVFKKFGIVKDDKTVQMDPNFREVLFSNFKDSMLKALEEVCRDADSSA